VQALLTGLIFAYISFLLAYFWRQWTTDCIRQLSVWLTVYDGIIALEFIRACILLRVWKTCSDPALLQVKIDFFWLAIFLGEIGWCVYGNTFIYTSGSQYCTGPNETSIDAFHLWVSTLIIICWGYCLMLYLICIFCFWMLFYCQLRERNKYT